MDEITDITIDKATQGDITAFEQIYNAYSGFVFNVSLRVTNNREDAKEITQDVCLKLHHKLSQFKSNSSIKTWIYRIAVNTSINLVKKEVSIKERHMKYHEQQDDSKSNNNVQDSINKEYQQKMVSNILNTLPFNQRICLILKHIEELSCKEIADVLETNINTIKTRLKRAREHILNMGKEVVTNDM